MTTAYWAFLKYRLFFWKYFFFVKYYISNHDFHTVTNRLHNINSQSIDRLNDFSMTICAMSPGKLGFAMHFCEYNKIQIPGKISLLIRTFNWIFMNVFITKNATEILLKKLHNSLFNLDKLLYFKVLYGRNLTQYFFPNWTL